MNNKELVAINSSLALVAILIVIITFIIKENNIVVISNNVTKVFIILLFFIAGMIMGLIMWLTIINKDSKEKKSIAIQIINKEDVQKKVDDRRKNDNKEMPISPIKELNIKVDILDVQTSFKRIEERLTKEINEVSKRANLNLVIGSVIAIMGWALFSWFIYGVSNIELEGWQLLNAFLPRLSIIIIIEMFSYFFLKLYRESMDRIRYYHNELTNIEIKKTAILVSCILENDSEHKKSLIENLISVERNYYLRKGETTIELEKLKIDKSLNTNILQTIKDLGLGLAPISTK